MPDGPFFGPQETLTGLIAAGSQVEEWRYRGVDAVSYVWFAVPPGMPSGAWVVIAIATYPLEAVY